MKGILRVGVLNNFNFTEPEFKQLKQYEDDWLIFVNSNAICEIKGKFPAIITINPNLTKFIEPKGDISRIAAVRIKYVSGANCEIKKAFNDSLNWAYLNNKNALITYMRFSSKDSLNRFVEDKTNYKWTNNYYRQIELKQFDGKNIYYCDLKKEGCPSCMNCAKLTYGQDGVNINSIDLSSSGECKFDCPDCYAKKLRKVFKTKFDNISKNAKQRGMKHG